MGLFKLKQNNTTIKKEIIGGLMTFIGMAYGLPLASSIIQGVGLSPFASFFLLAILSAFTTIFGGLVSNLPLAFNGDTGVAALIVGTICAKEGYNLPQTFIIVTISAIVILILSMTPLRKWVIESIPKPIQLIISASLGIFLAFIGLHKSGIVVSSDATLIAFGTIGVPEVAISLIAIFVIFILMISKKKTLSSLAIPIGVLSAGIIGAILSAIMIKTGGIITEDGALVYAKTSEACNLPILPWLSANDIGYDFGSVKDAIFYGVLSDSYVKGDFGNNLLYVIKTPFSYVSIFSICLVNIFDTAATHISVSDRIPIFDENGRTKNYRRLYIVDSVGSLLSGPMGSANFTPWAESNIGINSGAKTGLAAIVTGVIFLGSAFAYPLFSIFTSGCIIAPALVCIGGLIFVNNLKQLDLSDFRIGVTLFMSVLFTVISYSIATGIGVGIIMYVVLMVFSKKGKEVHPFLYVTASLFMLSLIINGVVEMTK